jgi:hypothetical protein
MKFLVALSVAADPFGCHLYLLDGQFGHAAVGD